MLKEIEVIKYRAFKIHVNILFFRINNDSKIFAIKSTIILILLSIGYSLISALFGWWGGSLAHPFRNVKNTLEAIHINLSGGVDYSDKMNNLEYDDKTNYVWNNLLRETLDKINKENVEIILKIQEEYEQLNKEIFTEDNIDYLISEFNKVEIQKIRKEEMKDVIKDIFNAIKTY
ncbi:MAG: hypothetical protein K8R54_19620 [Bacteroidales bacterium]|nr:hypothetical protein [Bacteroidales bacterium]